MPSCMPMVARVSTGTVSSVPERPAGSIPTNVVPGVRMKRSPASSCVPHQIAPCTVSVIKPNSTVPSGISVLAVAEKPIWPKLSTMSLLWATVTRFGPNPWSVRTYSMSRPAMDVASSSTSKTSIS